MSIRFPAIFATMTFLLAACGGGSAPPLISPPSIASSGKIADAERFQPIEGMANLYVSVGDEGTMYTNPMLAVRSESQSRFTEIGPLGTGWIHNFALSPGQWRFRLQFNTRAAGEHLLSEFDLLVEENTVVYIDCSKDIGSMRWIRVDRPVLRRFEDACPAGVEIENGIGACHVPYENDVTSWDEIINEGAYLGACEVVDAYDDLDERTFARSYTDMVTNADYEFAKAQELDTQDGWRRFIETVSDREYIAFAQNRIAELQAEQEYMAWEGEIQSILRRDSALPLQAQRDKYMIALTGYLQTQDFEPSLLYFELLDRLNIEQSDSITHFWGEALLRTGDPQGALEKLYEYINMAGSTGTYYRDALMLINEAEAAIDTMPAEPVETEVSPAAPSARTQGKIR